MLGICAGRYKLTSSIRLGTSLSLVVVNFITWSFLTCSTYQLVHISKPYWAASPSFNDHALHNLEHIAAIYIWVKTEDFVSIMTTTSSNVDAHEDEDGRRWSWSILGARALIGGWRYRIGECSPLGGDHYQPRYHSTSHRDGPETKHTWTTDAHIAITFVKIWNILALYNNHVSV